MKRRFFSVLTICGILGTASAQTISTAGSGPWNDPNTWAGGVIPTEANSTAIQVDHAVTIPSGYSVTVDGLEVNSQLTVATGGTLIFLPETAPGFVQNHIAGSLWAQNGSAITGTTGNNLVFDALSTYVHLFTTTEGKIPLASWNTTSTLSVRGYTTFTNATAAGNWSQAFGNVTWNCTSQTSTVNLNGLLTQVNKNLLVQSTNTGVLQFSTNQNPTINVTSNFDIEGTSRFTLSTTGAAPGCILNVGSFIFRSTNATGSSLATSGVSTVNVNNSFLMQAPGGLLRFATSGTTGVGTFNINGNFNLVDGTITEGGSDPTQGNFVFTGAITTHTFSNTGTISQRIGYTVPAGHTLRVLGESQLMGGSISFLTVSGKLILESTNATGAIMTGSGVGLGNVRVATRTFNAGSRLIYGGSAAQTMGNGQPATAGMITEINNAAGVQLDNTSSTLVTIGGDLVLTSGNLTVQNDNLTVNGNVSLTGGDINLTTTSVVHTVTIGGDLGLTGGTVNVVSGTVNANLILNGTVSGTRFLTFSGANSYITINGTGDLGRDFPVTGATTIKGVTVSRSGGTIVVSQPLTVDLLTVNDGAIDFNAPLLITSDVSLAAGTTMFIEDQTVEIRRYFNHVITGGVLSANSNTVLNILGTSGVLGTLTFSPTGNTVGTLVLNRTGSGTTIVLNSPLTIQNTLTLTDGIFNNISGLTMANGASVTRASTASFLTGSVAPSGGPYNLTLTGGNMSTGAESAGALNNVTVSAGTVTLANTLTAVGAFVLTQGAFISSTQNISVGSLTNGAVFSAPTTGTLALTGDFVNNGTFNRNGTVAFNGETTISGSVNPSFKNVTINGTLIAPATFPLTGAFTNNGTFTQGTGTVSFLGTAGVPQVISGTSTTTFNNMTVTNTTSSPDVLVEGQANLAGILTLASGAVFDADGAADAGVFTILSSNDDPVVDGAIATLPSIATQVTGNVTVQRYMSIEGGNNATHNNGRIYRYISSPVQNPKAEDIQNEIPITGLFTGSSMCSGCNTVQSMFYYDETLTTDQNHDGVNTMQDGYQDYPYLSNQETMVTGRGYTIFVRGDMAPISTAGNARWDVRGPINAGTVIYNATYTSSGNVNADGWNLVGNPYPSTIDWNAPTGWTKTGLTNTFYIANNGAYTGGPALYATFNGTVGTNGGSRYIPMGQAFFVKSDGGTVNFRSTEAVKAPGATTSFLRETQPTNVLRIALRQGTLADEAVIHYRKDATADYDRDMDAYKLANDMLNLSTMLPDGTRLAINSMPAHVVTDCGSVVKLDVASVEPGSYDLVFSNLSSFTDKIYFTLQDTYLGKSIPVTSTTVYPFEVATDAASFGAERFSLIMSSKPTPDLSNITTAEICPGQDGKVSIPTSLKGYSYIVQAGTDTLAHVYGTGTLLEITIPGAQLTRGINSLAIMAKDPVCSTLSSQVTGTLAVADVAPAAIVLTDGDRLASNYGAGNTWYLDDAWLADETQTINAEKSGTYKLLVTTEGCKLEATRVVIASKGDRGYAIYPNPVRRSKDILTIETSSYSGEFVAILSTTGKEISQVALTKTASEAYVGTFDFAALPAGIYFVRLPEGRKYKMVKILIF